MAIEEVTLPAFNLGIQDSEVFGNLTDAEAFLSGAVTTDPKDLKKKEEEDDEEEEKKAPVEKKKEPLKKKEETVDSTKLAEEFLGEEDEEEEEEKQEEKKAEEEDDDKKEEVNQFEALSKELYNIGVFSADEGEEAKIAKTPEEFLELFNQEKQKGATTWLENFLGRFGEDYRQMFDAVFVDGANPKEYIATFNEIESLQNLSITEESAQEKVVRVFYKQSGWSDEKIQAKIDKLKSYGDLEEEATTLHPLLVEKEKEKLTTIAEKAAAETQRRAALDEEYKQSITKILQDKLKEKNLDGLPLDEKKAQKAYDYLYTKKWKTPSGELLTDFDKFILDSKRPENIQLRTKIALLALDNFDFSKIEKKAVSKESNSLFSTLVQKKEKKSNKLPTSNSNVWANL